MTVRERGFGLVEAIVALGLAAIAFGALAASAHVATRILHRTATHHAATTAALERLEALRAGGRTSGSDVLSGLPPVARTWRHAPGRGAVDRLAVETDGDGARMALGTAVWP